MTSLIKKSKSISKREEGWDNPCCHFNTQTSITARKIHDQNNFSFSSELGQVTFFYL
jgi:hypothetical protein